MRLKWPAAGALLALTAGCAFFGRHSPTISRKEIPGIVNYSRVNATVGCAGATDVEAFPLLRREGYVSIVNLRREGEPGVDIEGANAAAGQHGLRYFHVPISGSNPSPEAVDRFLQIVADSRNQPVFIHCGSANRVGAVWLIKRVLLDGWSVEQATEEAEAIGLRSPALKAFAVEYVRGKGGPPQRL
jgi:uncharacterized protein (TIGR01244 family)